MGNLANIIISDPRPPTEEEVQSRKFTTYLNYLASACSFFGDHSSADEKIAKIVSTGEYKAIGRRAQNDLLLLVRLLRNAWFTEILLRFSHSSQSYLGYTNHWTPVQMYYSVYLQLRALLTAMGQTVSRDHTATLHAIGNQVYNRPALFFEPFCLALTGTPTKVSACSFVGVPSGITLSDINQLSSPYGEACWDHLALFIKTTRERQIDDGAEVWKQQNRKKRIPGGEKTRIATRLKPTTFFDAL